MNIVRIELTKPNSFWFLNDLHLGPGSNVSEPFDLDAADPHVKEKIDKAEKDFRIIKVIPQPEGTNSSFDINIDTSVRFELPRARPRAIRVATNQEAVVANTPMRPDLESGMPELQSFTIQDDPEPEIEETVPVERDFDEAKTLLSKNGNTIKRVVRSLGKDPKKAKAFLLACIEVEKVGKNRPGTIKTLEEAFSEIG